jgi:hypothetical protein
MRVVEGTISPAIGVLGLLASPIPQDDRLGESLRTLEPAALAALLDRIAFHRIDGLAYRAVSRLPQRNIDPWLRSALKRRAQRFTAATLSQALALAEVLEELDRSRIPVMVMRGVETVETVYGDPSLRPFEDHDLLVLPEDEPGARRALERLRFAEQSRTLFRRGGVILDLHTDPLGARRRPTRRAAFPVSVPDLFARASRGRVAGAPALLLQPEDSLLLLAIHLIKHSFDRLVRIADLSHFVFHKRGLLDWSVLGRRSESCGASKLLGWALQSAGILGVGVRAIDRPATEADGALERHLMARAMALRPLPWSGEILMMLATRGLGTRLRFLVDAFWPAGEVKPRGWRRAKALPRRVFDLAVSGTRQAAARRRAR